MTPDDPRHGSVAGYNRHRKDGEDACERCLKAAALYQDRRADAARKGRPYSMPPHGVRRRIQALMALGWSAKEQAAWLGWGSAEQINRLKYVRFVQRRTYADICRLYDALSGTPGPSAITRGRAQAAGYPPPLAWDDIDNPDARPVGHLVCGRKGCQRKVLARGLCHGHYHEQRTADREESAA